MKSFYFVTRGRHCRDFGISCISSNALDFSKPRFETKEVKGNYSPLLQFNKMRDRFILTIQVVIQSWDIYSTMSNIYGWLGNDTDDKPIYLSNIRDAYWEGFFEDITNIKDYNDTHVIATLQFNCKPLKQLKDGDKCRALTFSNNSSHMITTNRITSESRPTIVIPRTNELESFTITISSKNNIDQAMNIKGLKALPSNKKLILSGELQECYYIDDAKNLVPCNHLTEGDYSEIFESFEITISNLQGVSTLNLEVYPRWRVI